MAFTLMAEYKMNICKCSSSERCRRPGINGTRTSSKENGTQWNSSTALQTLWPLKSLEVILTLSQVNFRSIRIFFYFNIIAIKFLTNLFIASANCFYNYSTTQLIANNNKTFYRVCLTLATSEVKKIYPDGILLCNSFTILHSILFYMLHILNARISKIPDTKLTRNAKNVRNLYSWRNNYYLNHSIKELLLVFKYQPLRMLLKRSYHSTSIFLKQKWNNLQNIE